MRNWLKQAETLPKQVVVLGCIIFVTAVGLVDCATGYETFFFTFYLLAIFWGTALPGRRGALFCFQPAKALFQQPIRGE
jgi:hypothetical protein